MGSAVFQLSQLRCFVAVATELHFGRAAALLHMTQPPLTRQIQLLEHEVGVQLLDRSGGAVRLTPAGRIFLREAEDILRRSQAATLAARRAMQADAGSVTLGYIAAAGLAVLPQLLARIRDHLPEVHVVLREMQTFDQLDALAGDRIDLAVVRPFAPRSFADSAPLWHEPLLLAVPAGHSLAAQDDVALQALQGQRFIEYCPSETRYLYELIAGRLRAEGVAPDTVLTVSHTHSILSLVDAGWGVALVPRSSMRLGFAQVVHRPLRDPAGLHAELHLAWRREGRQPVAARVRTILQQAPFASGPPQGA
ncbi:MAG: LysR family transcriptional regulator [Delftia acidovorans]|jgi:DNA-binding transcriptional LysR family regulator|nr:LysR family transcriptional regulator [Delftia acidovorans]